MAKMFKASLHDIISYTLMVFLIAEVGFLIRQNRQLRSALDEYTNPVSAQPLAIGDKVDPINPDKLNEQTPEFGFRASSDSYLIFVFSTTCPHCEKTIPVWNQLVSEYQGKAIQFAGISIHDLDATRAFKDNHELKFDTYSKSDTSFLRKYKLSAVPQTLVISKDWKVQKIWLGELSTAKLNEIKIFMGAPIAHVN